MTRIAVVGTGYVGLPTGVAFAEHGHEVVCIDNDAERIAKLQKGIAPIVESGLESALRTTIDSGDLTFTTDLDEGIAGAQAVFCAVGTPETPSGAADVSLVQKVGRDVASLITEYTGFVIKSTVPAGTADETFRQMAEVTDVEFGVISNPEFMAEGTALHDVRKPSRIVIGISSPRDEVLMRDIYRTYIRNGHPFRVMSNRSAELVKHLSNGFLATKISFNNEAASLAQALGADIEDIRIAMGDDPRIGSQFMYVGPGWGGSCFPKDSRALIHTGKLAGVDMRVMRAADKANDAKLLELPGNVKEFFGEDLRGRRIALWGLAFKKGTDDLRESPAIFTLDQLLAAGAEVRAHDDVSKAVENAQARYQGNDRVSFGQRYEVLDGADALVIATDHEVYRVVTMGRLKELMRTPIIFDGRNMVDYELAERGGVYYHGNGRPIIDPGIRPASL